MINRCQEQELQEEKEVSKESLQEKERRYKQEGIDNCNVSILDTRRHIHTKSALKGLSRYKVHILHL